MSAEVRHIAEWRQHHHETLQQFATRLDVSITALVAWERGVRVPRERMRQRIADRLGVRYEQITYGERDTKEAA